MLLAIIFEHYIEVTLQIAEEDDQTKYPTIWAQGKEFLGFRKETKKHLPLSLILQLLELDDEPAHPEYEVTAKSLEAAFEGMSRDQADWLMRFLQKQKGWGVGK